MNYQASNPESLSETPERLSETPERLSETPESQDEKWFTSSSSSSKETSNRSANFMHKLEQLDCMSVANCSFAQASPGSDVIPRGGDHFRKG